MSGEADQVKWRGVRPVAGIRGVWPEINALRIQEVGSQDGLGTFKFYTVPAGKKLFISTGSLAIRQAAVATTFCRLEVRDSADTRLYYIFFLMGDIAGQQSSSVNFMPALELSATDYVSVYSSNAVLDVVGTIFGWLEDA